MSNGIPQDKGGGNSPGSGRVVVPHGAGSAQKVKDARAAKAAQQLRAQMSAPWSWETKGGDPADLTDFYWADGSGGSTARGQTRIKDKQGHTLVGSPTTGWYDPQALYGRDKHGKPIVVSPKYDKGGNLKNQSGATGFDAKRPKHNTMPDHKVARPGPSYTHAGVEAAFLGSKDPSEVQQSLYRAGFYGHTKPTVGLIGGDDQGAFHTAYLVYNQSKHTGETFQDWLGARGDARDASGGGLVRVKPTITLSDPLALRGSMLQSAPNALDRNLTETEMQGYINEIHSGETATAIAHDNANPKYADPTGTATAAAPVDPGGTITESGSATADAMLARYKRDHPAEVQATTMGQQGQTIMGLLSRHLGGGDSENNR